MKNQRYGDIYWKHDFCTNRSTMKCLEVLAQLANAEIARPDVVTRVRTQELTVVCEFNLSGLPLHLRQKKNKKKHNEIYRMKV